MSRAALNMQQQLPRPKAPAPVAPGSAPMVEGRVDFNALRPPPGYVPGLGRGATGFQTRSDLGPAAPGAANAAAGGGGGGDEGGGAGPSAAAPGAAAAAGTATGPYDHFLGNEAGALATANGDYDGDDREADRVWDGVDDYMEDRRRRAAGGAGAANGGGGGNDGAGSGEPKISEQFADLKRRLAAVTEAEWEAIPEIGDTTVKKRQRAPAYAPAPDSLLATALRATGASSSRTVVDAEDGGGLSTAVHSDLTAVGEGRGTVLGLQLDAIVARAAAAGGGGGGGGGGGTGGGGNGAGGSSRFATPATAASGGGGGGASTAIDREGYLTELSQQRSASAAEVADVKKARLLLKSVTATNPRHAPGWIAAARLEELAGDLPAARAAAARGCELCPQSEDAWLEASRLQPTADAAKAALARGVAAVPDSARLWLQAARLEADDAARSRVLRKALERLPGSVRLWRAAVDLAPTDDDARVLLGRAVECCPQQTELWLALARLETHEGAKRVLNRARLACPADASVWITAAKLEEAHGSPALAAKIVARALKSLTQSGAAVSREAWLREAEAAERAAPRPMVATCAALVDAVADLGVELEDRRRTWAADADEAAARGSVHTARALHARLAAAFPSQPSVWRAAANLERRAGDAAALDALLRRAVSFCPEARALWLMAAKGRWQRGDAPGARAVLAEAFSANPDSEEIWLAAFKLEAETGEVERARALLAKARREGGAAAATARVWVKSAALERDHPPAAAAAAAAAAAGNGSAGSGSAGDGGGGNGSGAPVPAREERALLEEGVRRFPHAWKLWMMLGQLEERGGLVVRPLPVDALPEALAAPRAPPPAAAAASYSAARAAYARGAKQCPDSAKLWRAAAALEVRAGHPARARALLEQARLRNPKTPELWLAAIRVEEAAAAAAAGAAAAGAAGAAAGAGAGAATAAAAGASMGPPATAAAAGAPSKAAEALLARALQDCPASGLLWAEAVRAAPRAARKGRSADALRRCGDGDARVVAAVAALFASDRKAERARAWFERAAALDADDGDVWAAYWAFERGQERQAAAAAAGPGPAVAAAAARTEAVAARAARAGPRHGERWPRVAKDPALAAALLQVKVDAAAKAAAGREQGRAGRAAAAAMQAEGEGEGAAAAAAGEEGAAAAAADEAVGAAPEAAAVRYLLPRVAADLAARPAPI